MNKFSTPVMFQGVHASPYTRKALGVLRYRRIPYRFIIGQPGVITESGHIDAASLPAAKPSLLPTFYTQGDKSLQAVTDTTPILEQLDADFSGRSVHPSEPILNLINYILEDYADEWLTRCMFHFRWAFKADIEKAGTLLPLMSSTKLAPDIAKQMKDHFSALQTSRLYVVGSNEITAPLIESSYVRLLGLLEKHFQSHAFLMGARPGSSDFGFFGQLTCLTHFDPTGMALTLEHSPRVYAWTERAEDLCGYEVEEADWLDTKQLPDTTIALLHEVARTHMPQLLANAKALKAGEKSFETEIDGLTWSQPSFPYQGKCLRWIREKYNQLQGEDLSDAQQILDVSGLRPLVDEII
jgi:glutathione S-transferase